ncbi:hypothetical protein [Sulfuracidifex tepidarius]|uniref:Uncharacterized protein n=1 Tax=Sulfuracidifex tepidarius TaxID=1294262 RepID=A0A510DYA4_9CREN|nr:hypothetical protein [Sulfuracidifex tepidarius]BBG25213.1 hypothetical protein IC006_2548 [Sulfuracidifex tepidarius]BBG28007.1 hypothetical protein IC007_2562 [Sulfuracidifex tepidarius]
MEAILNEVKDKGITAVYGYEDLAKIYNSYYILDYEGYSQIRKRVGWELASAITRGSEGKLESFYMTLTTLLVFFREVSFKMIKPSKAIPLLRELGTPLPVKYENYTVSLENPVRVEVNFDFEKVMGRIMERKVEMDLFDVHGSREVDGLKSIAMKGLKILLKVDYSQGKVSLTLDLRVKVEDRGLDREIKIDELRAAVGRSLKEILGGSFNIHSEFEEMVSQEMESMIEPVISAYRKKLEDETGFQEVVIVPADRASLINVLESGISQEEIIQFVDDIRLKAMSRIRKGITEIHNLEIGDLVPEKVEIQGGIIQYGNGRLSNSPTWVKSLVTMLSIIASAQPGSLVLVDEPEEHLKDEDVEKVGKFLLSLSSFKVIVSTRNRKLYDLIRTSS